MPATRKERLVRRGAWMRTCLVLLPVVTALALLRPAGAAFTSTTHSAGNRFDGDVLQPASAVSAIYRCLLTARFLTVSWTASPSTWASTYRVLRSADAVAWESVATVAYGTDTWTDTSVAGSTTYVYRVRVERTGWTWTSVDAESAPVTTPALCL